MSENEDWQFQVSPRLADGTMINVRGRNGTEFAQNLETFKTCMPAMFSLVQALDSLPGRTLPDPMTAAVQNVQQAMPGAQVMQQQEPNQYTCKHGNRVLRKSKPGSPREWTGYFCPTERGTPDQCPPVFVN